jgi:hypothetical protein
VLGGALLEMRCGTQHQKLRTIGGTDDAVLCQVGQSRPIRL